MQIVFYLINPWNFCPVFKWQIFSLNSGSLFLIFFKPLNLNLYHSNRAFMPGNGMAFESQTFRSPVEILLSESRRAWRLNGCCTCQVKTTNIYLYYISVVKTHSLDSAILIFLTIHIFAAGITRLNCLSGNFALKTCCQFLLLKFCYMVNTYPEDCL